MHRFVVMIQGEKRTYHEFDHIPQRIDHVIEFRPEIPPPPHTEQQHQEIHSWADRFDEVMRRERASSSEIR